MKHKNMRRSEPKKEEEGGIYKTYKYLYTNK